MGVKISINQFGIIGKIKDAWKSGLPALSEEVLADCNEYCKEDTGTLIKSSLIHSKPQKGKLLWQTPYARRQYWEIKTSLTAGRTWRWCETAKANHFDEWQAKAQKEFTDHL